MWFAGRLILALFSIILSELCLHLSVILTNILAKVSRHFISEFNMSVPTRKSILKNNVNTRSSSVNSLSFINHVLVHYYDPDDAPNKTLHASFYSRQESLVPPLPPRHHELSPPPLPPRQRDACYVNTCVFHVNQPLLACQLCYRDVLQHEG